MIQKDDALQFAKSMRRLGYTKAAKTMCATIQSHDTDPIAVGPSVTEEQREAARERFAKMRGAQA